MHDIRQITGDPEGFDRAVAHRGAEPVSAEVLRLDADRRGKIAAAESLRAERKAASRSAGAARERGDADEFERLRDMVAGHKARIAELEDGIRLVERRLREILLEIPNLAHDDVPVGPDEGLDHESEASFDNLAAVPKSLLTVRLGQLDPLGRTRMCNALRALADC